MAPLDDLAAEISLCRRCPRLVAWREEVAATKRAAYRDEEYWGRPVPGFGDPAARLLVLGLAPAAHGANRTGRMFTGDRSGDWLFRAMHRAGFASSSVSEHRDDGLVLDGAYVTAPIRCAPPANKPIATERDSCQDWLERELDLLSEVRVILALGSRQAGADLGSGRAGLVPPEPAEHLYGPLDGGDVRRGIRCRSSAGLTPTFRFGYAGRC